VDDIGSTTFTGLWDRAVEQYGSRPFLQFESTSGAVRRWTYAGFAAVVDGVAGVFHAHGVTPTRGVHLAVTNTPSFVAAWLAAGRLGSHIVPSDPMATAPELAEHIRRTVPAVGLRARTRVSVYDDALAESGVEGVTTFDVDETGTEIDIGSTEHATVAPPSPSDRLAVMFTSGTTGRPKGVVITQANYAFAGTAMAAACGLTFEDRQLVVLPLFHANAQYYSFASAIAVGASVALMHTFSASGFVDQAARHEATHASLFAGPMRMILARGGPRADVAEPPLQLRHCWFAQNLSEDQYETISTWFGCRPRQLYGMTETIPAVLTDRHPDPRPDIMGTVTPGCAVDVVNANGESCGPNEVGEIVVAGRRGVELFAEYLDDPATTSASFDGEWFHTGDRAWRDDDGRFHFDGRRADVLKVSGENVSVVEVEAVLSAHPLVLDAVVVGAPDPIRDEVPVAFVVPAGSPAGSIDEGSFVDELTAWCAGRLGKAKRPHRYVLVDELPRTSVGKIRKFLLTEAASRPPTDQSSPQPSAISQEVSP
jgi:crotonobetaine/carnitine-CoA ligase